MHFLEKLNNIFRYAIFVICVCLLVSCSKDVVSINLLNYKPTVVTISEEEGTIYKLPDCSKTGYRLKHITKNGSNDLFKPGDKIKIKEGDVYNYIWQKEYIITLKSGNDVSHMKFDAGSKIDVWSLIDHPFQRLKEVKNSNGTLIKPGSLVTLDDNYIFEYSLGFNYGKIIFVLAGFLVIGICFIYYKLHQIIKKKKQAKAEFLRQEELKRRERLFKEQEEARKREAAVRAESIKAMGKDTAVFDSKNLGYKGCITRRLEKLLHMIDDEVWSFSSDPDKFSILKKYLKYTEVVLDDQGKRYMFYQGDDMYITFNTGLFNSKRQNYVYVLAKWNYEDCDWDFIDFVFRGEGAGVMLTRNIPNTELFAASYKDNTRIFENLTIDDLDINYAHITTRLCERLDNDTLRVFEELVEQGEDVVRDVLYEALSRSIEYIRDNPSSIKNMYNRKHSTEPQVLIPLFLFDTETPEAALVVTKNEMGNFYIPTVLNLKVAYNCNRIIDKYSDGWLSYEAVDNYVSRISKDYSSKKDSWDDGSDYDYYGRWFMN